ncbi:hypothetical protein [Thiomicrospira microaerophila]|uniref:hypothetical protein n=1 Tax=Thiomicrospira microaerophila TaxID=406020 RepID=UPI0006975491|nr:hypothetical protein [Thiomicrospira microaerophila]
MQRRELFKKTLAGLAGVALAGSLTKALASGEVVIIASGDVSTSAEEAARAWSGRGNFALVNSAQSFDDFANTVLQRPRAQVERNVQKLVFAGRMQAPTELATDAQVIERVQAGSNTIGFVYRSSISGSVNILN